MLKVVKAVKNVTYLSALIVGTQVANAVAYEFVIKPIQKKIDSKKEKKGA